MAKSIEFMPHYISYKASINYTLSLPLLSLYSYAKFSNLDAGDCFGKQLD